MICGVTDNYWDVNPSPMLTLTVTGKAMETALMLLMTHIRAIQAIWIKVKI